MNYDRLIITDFESKEIYQEVLDTIAANKIAGISPRYSSWWDKYSDLAIRISVKHLSYGSRDTYNSWEYKHMRKLTAREFLSSFDIGYLVDELDDKIAEMERRQNETV